jgi:alpha-tubulin suppressor-like RCC1 family protein
MKIFLLTSKMKLSAISLSIVMALSMFAGASPSVQAEVTTPVIVDTKAVHIVDVGGRPYVLDDKGDVWGTSISSRAYRMDLIRYPGHLEKVEGLIKISSISASVSSAFALKEDGTVWNVEYVESSTSAEKDKWGLKTPKLLTQVPQLENIKIIEPYKAVDKDGKLWIWNDIPSSWKTGDWEKYFPSLQTEPVLVNGIDHIKDLSGATILKDDGTVWTWECSPWGCDMFNVMRSNNPIQIPGLTDIVKLGQGSSYDKLALKKDGTVWIWGGGYLSNPKFDGSGIDEPPAPIDGLTDIIDISIYDDHILALKKDGTVWSAGYFPRDFAHVSNTLDKENYRPPYQVEGLTDVTAVFAGNNKDAVIKKDGSLWMWGLDWQGLYGWKEVLQLSPVQVEVKPIPSTSGR